MFCWLCQYSFRKYSLLFLFLIGFWSSGGKTEMAHQFLSPYSPSVWKDFLKFPCVQEKNPIAFGYVSPLGRIIHPEPAMLLIVRNSVVGYISNLSEPVMYSRCSQVWMQLKLLVQMTLILGVFKFSTLLVSPSASSCNCCWVFRSWACSICFQFVIKLQQFPIESCIFNVPIKKTSRGRT